MTLLLIVFGLSFIIEAILFLIPSAWKNRNIQIVLAGLATLFISFMSTGFVVLDPSYITAAIVLVGYIRVLNLLRVVENRMQAKYLWYSTRRTSLITGVVQASLIAFWVLLSVWHVSTPWWILLLVSVQLFIAITALLSTLRTLHTTRIPFQETGYTSDSLPTVTVAVPARNETDDLESCLHSLVNSDYPKLEILVLDDCSQLKRTPAILRDFAHAGIRFLRGDVPEESWLAKNYAYEKLATEANGDIILFCGVDIRFEPWTIRHLVQTLHTRNKRMISVLPLRHKPSRIQASLTQAARYAWEIIPPRRLFKRPPVLSSCWLIYKDELVRHGSFSAVRRSITPEAYFARKTAGSEDNYAFVRGDAALGLWSAKNIEAQRQTATRTRYPSLRKRPEVVLGVSLFELTILLGTYIIAGLGIFGIVPSWALFTAIISIVLFSITYMLIAIATKVNSWYVAPFLLPVAILGDIVLMYRSMWLYEFSEVIWKGRNVCLPVMYVTPTLPPVK